MKQIALLLLSLIILCTACFAQAAEKELPVFTSIWDAINSTEGYAEVHDNEDSAVLIVNMGDSYIRMFSLLDDHAKELYKTAEAHDYPTDLLDAYAEYAWSLPLSCIEELPEPLSQAELDGLKGKTLQQLIDDGFGKEMILHESELASPVAIGLENGFYQYRFEVTEAASGYPDMMRIKSGKFNGLSRDAFEMDIQEKHSNPK